MLTLDEKIISEMLKINDRKNISPSLKIRKLNDRKIVWTTEEKTIDENLVIKNLATTNYDEIEQTAKLYRIGFPELFGGVYEDILFPGRYKALLEEMKLFLLKEKDQVVSAWALITSEKNMSTEFSLTVTSPKKRGKGYCRLLTNYVEEIVKNSGTEHASVYCATFHTATQKIFTGLGFKKEAELKGFVLANVGNGNYARDNVIMYSKMYNDAEKLCPEIIKKLKKEN